MRNSKRLQYGLRRQVYIKISLHPRYDDLPERCKSVIDTLAAGGTLVEIAKIMRVTDSMTGLLRNQALHKLGFTVVENGKCRTMTILEVKQKLKL